MTQDVTTAGRIGSTFRSRAPDEQPQEAEPSTGPRPVDQSILDRQGQVDQDTLLAYRLERVRAQLRERDVAGALLADPLNIRYATGTRNMMLWTMHSPARYAFVSTDGPVIVFEMSSNRHLSTGFTLVDEVRTAVGWFYLMAGSRLQEKTTVWADEIAELVRTFGAGNPRLLVDRCEPTSAQLLTARGLQLSDANEAMEMARIVKSEEELECFRIATAVGDRAIDTMRSVLRPGMTENQFWAVLHEVNISHNGEWIECRLLTSGERTNPWFQECGNHVIESGDLVSFDTDMVGPLGYMVDLSRSFVCPGRRATAEQRTLYDVAQHEVMHNLELLRPGVSFREFAEKAWKPPAKYFDGRYPVIAHGTGFVDEYPFVPAFADFDLHGYDGIFVENMVVSVESYIGTNGGKEGVKLEQQAVVTANGAQVLSQSPFLDALEL